MRVLVTGHNGYIGAVLVPMLQRAGHDVAGLDSYLFQPCVFGEDVPDITALRKDVRDVTPEDVAGFDAVIHLAALSNDPLGDFDASITYDINFEASLRLAQAAKQAGVQRFLYSSSCSAYGASGDAVLTEEASFNPVTPYAVSKIRSEESISKLADSNFSPTFLRNATAYGVSSRLRGDLVVNNLVGFAFTTGEVLIKSDGTPWRPLVHIEDISRAFVACMEAPREAIHNQAFNVGSTAENYQVRELADMVHDVVPNSSVTYAEGGGPDLRCYRVDCSKIARMVPAFQPQWTVRRGVEELYEAYKRYGLTEAEFLGPRYLRLQHIKELIGEGKLDASLRWLAVPSTQEALSGRD